MEEAVTKTEAMASLLGGAERSDLESQRVGSYGLIDTAFHLGKIKPRQALEIDGGWRLHSNVNVSNVTELCTREWLVGRFCVYLP